MRKTTRRSAFAAALLLSTALCVAASTAPAFAARGADSWQVWASSKYTYCDAKLLAATWHMSVEKAKTTVAAKVLLGDRRGVESALVVSRNAGNRCTFEDSGYSYNDAEKLAGVWHMAQPYQAKLYIAKLVTQGRNAEIRSALR